MTLLYNFKNNINITIKYHLIVFVGIYDTETFFKKILHTNKRHNSQNPIEYTFHVKKLYNNYNIM